MRIEKGSMNHRNLQSIRSKLSDILGENQTEKEALTLLLDAGNRNIDSLISLLSGKKN